MKKNNKTIMLVVLIAIFAINAHAQNNNSVSYNEYGTINRIGFEKGYIRSSQEFFNSILNVGNDKTFVKSDTYVDEFGGLHEKYDQYFEGIKVSGGGYVLNYGFCPNERFSRHYSDPVTPYQEDDKYNQYNDMLLMFYDVEPDND